MLGEGRFHKLVGKGENQPTKNPLKDDFLSSALRVVNVMLMLINPRMLK